MFLNVNEIPDKGMLWGLRMGAQEAFVTIQEILTEEHGPLGKAPAAKMGELIPVEMRFENYGDLFKDTNWPQILEDVLGTAFVGFPSGSIMDVHQSPGRVPVCTGTCIVRKNEVTRRLQTDPMKNCKFTLQGSSKVVTCDIAVYERSLSCIGNLPRNETTMDC